MITLPAVGRKDNAGPERVLPQFEIPPMITHTLYHMFAGNCDAERSIYMVASGNVDEMSWAGFTRKILRCARQ